MKNVIDEKRKKRFQFLNALYEYTGGNRLEDINDSELGEKIGFSPEESDQISSFLSDEGLIEFTSLGGQISITHKGIIEIENALSNPKSETQYFPPTSSIVILGPVTNSNIQQGNHNQIQFKNYSLIENQNEVINLLQEIQEKISELKLPQDSQKEAEAEIKTIKAQIDSPKPKQVIIQESLNSIKTILEGVAGNVLADILLKKIIGLL